MKPHEALDRLIAEQSSQWLEILKRDGTRERQDFVRWLKVSARHVQGFLLMTALDEELKYLDPQRRYAARRLREPRVEELPPLPALHNKKEVMTQRRIAPWAAALAAGIAALIIIGQLTNRIGGHGGDFRTALGEQH